MKVTKERREYVQRLKDEIERDFMMKLREKVRYHNLTQAQVGYIVAKDRTAVNAWLNGRYSLRLADTIILADFFEIKVPKRISIPVVSQEEESKT